MKLLDKITGIAGILLVLAAMIWYSIGKIWGTFHWIFLILGILAVGYFLFMYYTKRERIYSKKSLKEGSNLAIQIIVVLAIAAMVAFISTQRHLRADWSANKLYSLADQTVSVLENLQRDVTVKAFFKSSEQKRARDLLDEYDYRSGNFSYELIDPDEEPQITQKYGVQQYGTLIVESGQKTENVETLEESNLTNAIIKVTRDQDKVIYFLTGHGEASVKDESKNGFKQAADAIKKENHLVRELNLVRRRSIPDSCTALAIISPKQDLFPAELDTIQRYVQNGGKLLLMTDPEHPRSVKTLAETFHVSVANDLVIDASGVGQLFGAGPAMPLVTTYDQNHAITEQFGNTMTFYPQASSLRVQEDKDGYSMTELLKTSGNSWGETDYKSGQVSFDASADTQGPITLAVIAEKKTGDQKSIAAIFGDSDFARNAYFSNQSNSDLFLNTINYLVEEEDLISIRPKQVDDRRLTLTQADVSTLFYLVVIAIPVIVVILGVVVFFRRNKA
ncbi:MAG: hypothetical protein GF313_07070 [Caldithrix sp.]|nr:hypothetical protein [Caldithrix sp.]